MPTKNARATKARTGKTHVTYRALSGRTYDAVVLSVGSTTGLKLLLTALLPVGKSVATRDNVPAATGMKQTNVYFAR